MFNHAASFASKSFLVTLAVAEACWWGGAVYSVAKQSRSHNHNVKRSWGEETWRSVISEEARRLSMKKMVLYPAAFAAALAVYVFIMAVLLL